MLTRPNSLQNSLSPPFRQTCRRATKIFLVIFGNPTVYHALLLSTVLEAEHMMASVVVRVTYNLGDELAVADEQAWRVSPEPWDSPGGKMEEDGPFMRGVVDLFAFGMCPPVNLASRQPASPARLGPGGGPDTPDAG
jgi:hypothetical protein